MNNKEFGRKKKLRLVERYDNDDYSRIAGPDYSDGQFEIGEEEIRQHPNGYWTHPGISGKMDHPTNFTGYGPKGYRPNDERIYEKVCETLMTNSEVDASNIGVKVESGIVYLSGKVDSRRVKKMVEMLVENLSGVQDVRNELTIISQGFRDTALNSVTKKDLGIN